MNFLTSRREGTVNSTHIELPKLIRDIRKILQHPALALPYFPPFSFFFFPALEKLRGGIVGATPTKKRLS